jgi:holo-[acyl-carrier protein] synthase
LLDYGDFARTVQAWASLAAGDPEKILTVPVRVGIDLVTVDSVRESLDAHGEHYLERVYTAREREDCVRDGVVDPERLAGRFAAKEATLKALRPGDVGVPWYTIEVVRDPGGWVDLELSGAAAEVATSSGLTDLALSITHEGGFASAVVIAGFASGTGETIR